MTAKQSGIRAESFSTQVSMFHVDIGKVYIWPEPIKKKDIGKVKLPNGFDSVMVDLHDVNVMDEPRLGCLDKNLEP